LLDELIKRSEAQEKGVNIYIVHVYLAMDDRSEAKVWLAKAKATNDVDLIWLNIDPLLKDVRTTAEVSHADSSPDFQGAENHIHTLLKTEMPSLPYHNIHHIQDVLQAAVRIAETEQVTGEDLALIRLAALFHDVGFIRASKGHEAHGADMAKEILPAYGLNEKQIESICSMIMATRLPQSPQNKLDRILCDADLDYLGRDDFYETGSKLFEEMKAQGAVETEREWNLVQKTFLESHRYHTDYARNNREKNKQERLSEIAAKLKNR